MLSHTAQKIFATPVQQLRLFSACSRAFPNEPMPLIKTSFPSPKTLAFKTDLADATCTLATHFPVDLGNSLGNIVQDADGNRMLDVFTSIGTNAVGYNHPKLLATADTDFMQMTIATRTGLGINPMKEQGQINQKAFMSVAPPGMERVTAAMCGTCANEGAFKVAMMAYAQKKRGTTEFAPTEEELSSCMSNLAPGSPDFAILSLKQGFHGRLMGSLSTSRTKNMHKVDIPAFNWPAAQNPVYKYPLTDNADYNREQDQASLKDIRAKID